MAPCQTGQATASHQKTARGLATAGERKPKGVGLGRGKVSCLHTLAGAGGTQLERPSYKADSRLGESCPCLHSSASGDSVEMRHLEFTLNSTLKSNHKSSNHLLVLSALSNLQVLGQLLFFSVCSHYFLENDPQLPFS